MQKIFKINYMDLIKLLVGSFLYSFAVNVFVVPNHLYSGGILGLSQLIRSLSLDIFNLNINFDFSSIIYYIFNIPLFILAYKNIGKSFFYRTLFAVSFQTILLSILPIPNESIVPDLLTNVILGAIIGGLGSGLILSSGSSTGGTDIIGIILAKKKNEFSVGKLALLINIFIFTISGIKYGIQIMIYSLIYSTVGSLIIDKTHDQNICSTAFIFCKRNPKIINEYIKNELERDFTYWDAKGGYDDSRTYIIYTVLSKYELQRLERFIKSFDSSVFIIKSEGVKIKGLFDKKF